MVKNSVVTGQLREWFIAKDSPPSVALVALTTVAIVASYLIARLFRLQEAYWAPTVGDNSRPVDTDRGAASFRAICRGNSGRSNCRRSNGDLLPGKRLGVWSGYFRHRFDVRSAAD